MQKVALIILDGWGHGEKDSSNAIFQAKTPYIDSLYNSALNTELRTDGQFVGLPKGQMGNSEVGHLNIGAGRIVYQNLEKINNDIKTKRLNKNKILLEAIEKTKAKNKALHLMGLLSDGGIHSHIKHLEAICDIAIEKGINQIFIHAFTDGRDTDPRSGKKHILNFNSYIKNKPIKIVSIIGRYYAMDRDKRWERTSLAYNALINGEGQKSKDIIQAIDKSYEQNITDEFILPIINTDSKGVAVGRIEPEDNLICFNFRSDRCRQIVSALTQLEIPQYAINSLDINLYTMTQYDDTFEDIKVLYPKENIKNTIGEVIANKGLTQLRIAETEKYPHVTFFFSGGQEEKFKNEYRVLIPSPKVATYDLHPDMSAEAITNAYINEVNTKEPDFICLNYANPDMVGHTGDFNAVTQAIEKIDQCTKKIVLESIKKNYAIIIISDHGNAEFMVNEDNTPNTAHTTNKVPCFILNSKYKTIKKGSLSSIAPSILKIMDIEIPQEMNGTILIN